MPLLTALTLVALLATAADSQWPQWGGPRRDFQAADVELDASWPESGPPRLWMRTLGEGYSAIAVVDGVLFTMYRRDDDTEVVVAIDAASGETRWEHAYEGSISGLNTGYGDGPHSTPLIHAGAVYTVGVRSLLLCLDAETGERRWSRDLWGEFDAEPRRRGFASSPVVYQELLILPVGGDDGHGVMAFDLDTGAVAWKSQDVGPTFSSPILIDVDGQDQLVSFGSTDIIGLDPASGERLWSHPHPTQYNVNAATPVWGAGQLLFTSSAYDAGSRVIRLQRAEGRTTAEELWYDRTLKIHHGTAVRRGDMIYASSGDFGPAFLMAAHAETGEIAIKQRGFAKANLLGVGDRLILLDEKGVLALLRPGADGFEVLAQAQVLTERAWTVPTLVGTTLYARDRERIVALDLSPR